LGPAETLSSPVTDNK